MLTKSDVIIMYLFKKIMFSSNSLKILSLIGVLTLINCAVPNCKIPGSDTTCVQCNEGYNVIQNGTCLLADPNCASIFFSNGACFQCKTGYTITGTSNGRCVNASKTCKTFQADGNTCSQCYQGYCKSQGNCITGDSNCKTFNSLCQCATCYYGSPIEGKCKN